MNKILIELEFDNAVTKDDVYEYLIALMEDDELDYTIEQD